MNLLKYGKQFLICAALMSFLWWVFVEGDSYQILFGVIVVIISSFAVTHIALRDVEHHSIRIWHIFVFAFYFIQQTVKGGIGVALLSFLPKKFTRPYYVDYKYQIPLHSKEAKLAFAAILCIFPGSLASETYQNGVQIHVLDERLFNINDVIKLEKIIAGILGEDLFKKPKKRASTN